MGAGTVARGPRTGMAQPTAGASEADDPLIGRVLDGRYRIVERVAAGGMGRVYRAMQEPLGRTVAIKILTLDPRDAAADAFRQRFFREASICARLKHPNTVRIHDYGQTKDDIYYIAMEFLDGQTLRDAMTPGVPMEPMRAIDLMTQICASLAEAHSMGLIHRDLKPSNIILTRHADGKEYVNVVDFGLVKDIENSLEGNTTTETGLIVGSPSYMSPEQILQQDLTPRSDIYSLGVLLYVMLTGRKPFRQESLAAVIHRHLNAPPPSFAKINPGASIPPNLEWVTMTCLSKDPESRFASANELVRALQACGLELSGRFSRIEMSLTDGRLRLPSPVDDAVGFAGTRSAARTTSGTMPSLVRQAEPSSTRVRLPMIALLMGFPVMGILALILLGTVGGIGIAALVFGGGRSTRPTEIPDAIDLMEPPPPDPVPAPRPAPRPEPHDAVAPVPQPAPSVRPQPRPEPRPEPRPVSAPAPGTAPGPQPAAPVPQPVVDPLPTPVPAPQPAGWDDQDNDLKDPWED